MKCVLNEIKCDRDSNIDTLLEKNTELHWRKRGIRHNSVEFFLIKFNKIWRIYKICLFLQKRCSNVLPLMKDTTMLPQRQEDTGDSKDL